MPTMNAVKYQSLECDRRHLRVQAWTYWGNDLIIEFKNIAILRGTRENTRTSEFIHDKYGGHHTKNTLGRLIHSIRNRGDSSSLNDPNAFEVTYLPITLYNPENTESDIAKRFYPNGHYYTDSYSKGQ